MELVYPDGTREPLTIVDRAWWSWGWDERGEVAHLGHTLPCGHEITATSRTSQTQLVRNYRRMAARHVAHLILPLPGI